MSGIGLEKQMGRSVTYYPEESYTHSEASALIGVSEKEVKSLVREGGLNITGNKIRGFEIASYLVNHAGFERLRELGYKGSKRDIAITIGREAGFFSGYPSLDELINIASSHGIRVPELNGDRREAKLALTAILTIAENGQATFGQICAYCKERLPYYHVDRTVLSGLLNKRLKAEGLIRKSGRMYYLNT